MIKYLKILIFSIISFIFLVSYAVSSFKNTNIENQSDAYYLTNNITSRHYKDIKMFECAWCHRKYKLNRHHIIPTSADPTLKNEYSNIIILCRDCHFVLGHKCNWKQFNPDVKEIVTKYTNTIISINYYNERYGN